MSDEDAGLVGQGGRDGAVEEGLADVGVDGRQRVIEEDDVGVADGERSTTLSSRIVEGNAEDSQINQPGEVNGRVSCLLTGVPDSSNQRT